MREQYTGRFGAIARPWLLAAATALWVARPLFPSESAASQGDGLPAVMLWIVLAVFWLLGAIGRPKFRLRFGWVDLAVLLLVAWHALAAVWAAMHLSPRPAVNMLWEWVGLAISFLLTRQLLAGPREARAVVAVMGGLAVALAAYGLYQYQYEMPATRAAYEADPDKALAEANLWFPPGSPEREVFQKRLASVEPMATFALTNSLAGYLAPWLVLLAGIAALGRSDRRGLRSSDLSNIAATETVGNAHRGVPEPATEASLTVRGTPRRAFPTVGDYTGFSRAGLDALWSLLAPVVCAVIVAACLLLTKSRSACLAVLFGLALLGSAWRRTSARTAWKFVAWTAILLAVLAAIAVAVGGLDVQVFSEAGTSLGYRGQYWRSSLAMIRDHPLVGCGPGNFQESYKFYKLPEASEEIADPHNFLLEIWATAGTPAALALAAGLVGFFVAMLRRTTFSGRPEQPEKALPQRPDDRHTKEHPGFVYAGAAAAFAVVVPISAVSPAPPQLALFLVAAPCLVGAIVLLWTWVAHGHLPAGLVAIGVAVLLLNLAAAGGIGFAGVGGSLWLLIALGLTLAEADDGRWLPGWTAFTLLAGAVAVAFACYATGYGPVLRSQSLIRLAQTHPRQMENYLLEAANDDPLSAEPWSQLAAIAFAEWSASPTSDSLRRFNLYTAEMLRRAPNSSAAWQTAGDRAFQVYGRTGQSPALEGAEIAMRKAAELYPNSAVNRAKLAIVLRAAGKEADYEAERRSALRLDELTPHLDKKLPAELRKSLQRTSIPAMK